MAERFTWVDGERTIRFGRGVIGEAPRWLGVGYTLLTTARASAAAPAVVEAAATVHLVPPGRVDEVAAGLLAAFAPGDPDPTAMLVALGGGRVIDVAKAVAAASGGLRVAAVPTTLSAAEMTRSHRHAAGVDPATPRARPAVVLHDCELSASMPPAELAGSAANALAHAVEGPATVHASPVPSLAGREAARRIALAAGSTPPDTDELALGALLSGYCIDSAGIGLHHVLSQTLVRVTGIAHGSANAALLPHTLAALARRTAPDAVDHVELAHALAARAGASSLRALGVERGALEVCASAAVRRPELHHTPPAAGPEEIHAIYLAAW